MKKLLAGLLVLGSVSAWADDTNTTQTATVLVDPASGRPVSVPVVSQPVLPPTTVQSPQDVAQFLNPWPNGYIYYTMPGGINLVTPWSAAILAWGHDYIGNENLTQGYVPLATWWKITGIVGGGMNSEGRGSPLAGGMLNLVSAPIAHSMDFHIIVTGGYDFNGHHALAVLSPSVQFLK